MQQLSEPIEDMTLDDIGKTPVKMYLYSFVISTILVYSYKYFCEL